MVLSGAIINADQIDMTLDIDTVSASGGRLGCGTILVIDDSNCIVDIVRNNLDFFRGESCGKCTPCREGGSNCTVWLPASAGGWRLCRIWKNR
ncbi:MAG: NADH-ubiquinone oxidoreductase-F iron-sulfur binding region domain-containing protein [Clostridium fessum]